MHRKINVRMHVKALSHYPGCGVTSVHIIVVLTVICDDSSFFSLLFIESLAKMLLSH